MIEDKSHWRRYFLTIPFLIVLIVLSFMLISVGVGGIILESNKTMSGKNEAFSNIMIAYFLVVFVFMILIFIYIPQLLNKMSKVQISNSEKILFSSVATWLNPKRAKKIHGKLFLSKNELIFLPVKKNIDPPQINLKVSDISIVNTGGFSLRRLVLLINNKENITFFVYCKEKWIIHIKKLLKNK